MADFSFRKANYKDADSIWTILQQAIERRKNDGSKQWQDGYPNPNSINEDIEKGVGYVLLDDEKVIGYSAVLINYEPAYEDIDGKWLSNGDFIVVHRVAISEDYIGQGLSKKIFEYIEGVAKQNSIKSIKVDTNFDNLAMIKILDRLDYIYCGEVHFRGSPRKAFEKLL